MGGSGSWLKSLIFHRKHQEKGSDKSKRKWNLWRSSSEGFGCGTSMKKGHGGSYDKYSCSSFVVNEEAFAAAMAAVVRTPHKDFMVIKQEWAAIRIQSAFRGFLARQALRALRAVVRIQAIFRGRLVRKQAAVTLRCMQALVRVQERVKARNVRNSTEEEAGQKLLNEQNVDDPVKQAEEGWCDIPGTVDEVKAKLKMRKEAAIKRDRTMAYSISTQKSAVSASPNSKTSRPMSPLKHHSLDSKSLLERWIAGKPWESRLMGEINLDSPDMTPLSRKTDDGVHFNSHKQKGSAKAKRNGATSRIFAKSLENRTTTSTSQSKSTPSSSSITSDCMYDDSPVSTSFTSESMKEETKFGKPSYTKLTASTKAKQKDCRTSSQNLKRLFMDDCLSYSSRRDFLSADTRSISGSYSSANIWKDLYATPLRKSCQKRYTLEDK